jgi:hypothetical protein
MMKSAEDRLSGELAEPLDRPMARRILTQGRMRSQFVVIAGVGCKDPAQMRLAQDDDVIHRTSLSAARTVAAFPQVGGLHHRYERRAA